MGDWRWKSTVHSLENGGEKAGDRIRAGVNLFEGFNGRRSSARYSSFAQKQLRRTGARLRSQRLNLLGGYQGWSPSLSRGGLACARSLGCHATFGSAKFFSPFPKRLK